MKQETNKEIEELKNRLFQALKETRDHPGLPLKEIASICRKVFDIAEMEAFIEDLKKELEEEHQAEIDEMEAQGEYEAEMKARDEAELQEELDRQAEHEFYESFPEEGPPF